MMQCLHQTNQSLFSVSCQSMMIEPVQHSFATVKAEVPTKVGHMTGPVGIGNGEVTRVALEVQDHGLGWKILMET